MGLFSIFKKKIKETRTTDNGVLGPIFLDGLTDEITEPKGLQKHEWRRNLRTPSGQRKFKIKYFGQLHPEYQNLIVGQDDKPLLVFAIEPISGQEILIFDGCNHGYNALFCDNYSADIKTNRKADKIYKTEKGEDTFALTISAYYGIDYDDEFSKSVDDNGLLKLNDGTKVAFETVKRNGFDTFQIFGTEDDGEVIEIVSEELA